MRWRNNSAKYDPMIKYQKQRMVEINALIIRRRTSLCTGGTEGDIEMKREFYPQEWEGFR
jgi:hypothetical protein